MGCNEGCIEGIIEGTFEGSVVNLNTSSGAVTIRFMGSTLSSLGESSPCTWVAYIKI